ncbi:hypothetical protein Mpet_0881 [Methanolacinia petrolearia DSM 11571]|uniref:Uncharacterized protein n=1 Tax=Methanolacinia petrolearia (strain DSM 11571 / OCM 486 / SEBR 4847) TaxID=679926 RepID=E1RJD1_METP4|nr:hypothetical protein [Methanolacinia petrolearia]ADN35649.1 hypothetical protein Mpet_0881 [Methanolacinia petrolearia DSM 11571]
MIYDEEKKGYFERGKFICDPIPSKANICRNEIHMVNDGIKGIINENLDFNLPIMPDLLSESDFSDSNLYSIYKQAFFSIASGLYDAGLILIGQLLEITVKEIVLIKTGKLLNGKNHTFGYVVEYVLKENILDYDDILYLRYFLNKVRNPYTHRNLKEIVGFHLVPVFLFPTQKPGETFNPTEFIQIIKTVMDGIKTKEFEPQWISATSDTSIACQIKEENDQQKAIFNIWLLNIKIDQLINIYLNQEAYNGHIKKYGSPYEKLAQLQIFEDIC